MNRVEKIRVPNIGDFSDVEVIDIVVKIGDAINMEDPLVTLESDKASIDTSNRLKAQ